MSSYQPPHPLPLPSTFNASYFEPIDFLTITDADLRYISKTNPVITGNLSVGGTTSSSNFRAADGLVSAPSYSFTNANNYGLFYDAPNTNLNLVNNGSTRITIGNANTTFANPIIASSNIQVGTNGTLFTYIRRLAPTSTITLGSNSSGNSTISLGITAPNTNYDVHINIINISNADHITFAYDNLTTTNFRVVYKNSGSGSADFQIQCTLFGY